jgi:hypothetical protein
LRDGLPRAVDAKSNEVNAVFAMVDKSSGCNSATLSVFTLNEYVFTFIQILWTIYRLNLPENFLMEMRIFHLGILGSRLISNDAGFNMLL